MLFKIILPGLFIALSMILSNLRPNSTASLPPVVLVPWQYDSPNYVFYSFNNFDSAVNQEGSSYFHAMTSSPGLGTLCMKNDPLQ